MNKTRSIAAIALALVLSTQQPGVAVEKGWIIEQKHRSLSSLKLWVSKKRARVYLLASKFSVYCLPPDYKVYMVSHRQKKIAIETLSKWRKQGGLKQLAYNDPKVAGGYVKKISASKSGSFPVRIYQIYNRTYSKSPVGHMKSLVVAGLAAQVSHCLATLYRIPLSTEGVPLSCFRYSGKNSRLVLSTTSVKQASIDTSVFDVPTGYKKEKSQDKLTPFDENAIRNVLEGLDFADYR